MNPDQALDILNQIASAARMDRASHAKAVEALGVLQKIVSQLPAVECLEKKDAIDGEKKKDSSQ